VTLVIEISCREVRRELSNYVDDEISRELRERIELHVDQCKDCRALLDGVNNVLRLVSTGEVLQLPAGFSQRLQHRLKIVSSSL